MKKIFKLIGNIFAIIIIGIVLAKLRVKVKYFYFVILGAISICLGVGFGAISLAFLGFDVGGNSYTVLVDYSIFFSICAVLTILLIDRIVVIIQESILEFSITPKINFLQISYSFISGAGLIAFFFIVPDILGTISILILLIWSIIYGLKSKITNQKINDDNKRTDIKYENLINSADVRSLYSRFGYKNEEEWTSKAREMIKKDPKKFADILSYDVTKSDLRKRGIF
jgi:hypothetical protein